AQDLERVPASIPSDPGLGSQGSGSEPKSNQQGLVVALVTTGGLTALSAGLWIGFAVEGGSLQGEGEDLRGGGLNCAGPQPSSRCSELSDVTGRRATANQVAVIGAVATGVSAAAFLGVLFFWPRARSGSIGSSLVLPHFSTDRAGIDVVG